MFARRVAARSCAAARGLSDIARPARARGWGVGMALGAVAGLGACAAVAVAATDEGVRRSAKFWTRAMPVFLHYKYVQYSTKGLTPEARTAEFEKVRRRRRGSRCVVSAFDRWQSDTRPSAVARQVRGRVF